MRNDDEVEKIAKDFNLSKASVMRVAEPVWIQACRAVRELNPLYGTNIAAMVSRWGHARDGLSPGMIAYDEEEDKFITLGSVFQSSKTPTELKSSHRRLNSHFNPEQSLVVATESEE